MTHPFRNLLTLFAAICISATIGFAQESTPIGKQYRPESNFKASWITPRDLPAEIPNLWLAFRKSFDLETLPKKALCRIACDSKYWLYLNGKLVVYEGGLKRGPTPHDSYVDQVDLAPYLQEGENTLAILVWYFGKDGFSHLDSGQPALFFDASTNGEDGLFLVSDDTWKAVLYSGVPKGLKIERNHKRRSNLASLPANWRSKTEGPYEVVTADPQPNRRLSEWNTRFDARYDFKGDWKAASYDDSHWPVAQVLGKQEVPSSLPWGDLYLRSTPLWKDYGLRDYVNASEIPEISTGEPIVCKLPYNAQVSPWLAVEGPAGALIDIRTDNYEVQKEYCIRCEYITKEGKQEFEFLTWFNGHKVIYSIPKGVRILGLKYRETGYDTQFAGSFHCDDPFFNRLWEKATRTLYITMRDTYYDCPDRERAQWWGDAVVELGEAFYALDRNADLLARKGFYELIRFQNKEGIICSPIPGNYKSELPAQMLATVGVSGIGTWSHFSGNLDVAEDLYDGIKKYLNVWQFDEKGLVLVRKGGWNWADWGDNFDLRPILNCWYYLAAKEALEIATRLDRKEDVICWKEQMRKIKNGFNKEFWTGKEYRDPFYKGESDDRMNALAILCGFPEKEWAPLLCEHFQKEKHASPYMEKYVLEAICQLGYPDLALSRMKERFDKMVNHPECTTLWEFWVAPTIASPTELRGTVNHAWSGGGLTCLAQYIVGLSPVEPGFKSFQIVPQLGFLKNVSMTTPTKYGAISIEMQRTDQGLAVSVVVPQNTNGTFFVPAEYTVPEVKETVTFFEKKFVPVVLKPGKNSFNFQSKK